jgi:zinc transport system permease protein
MTSDVSLLALAIPAALAIGLVGGFAQLKQMTLAGDTMSHIALPGIGLALVWGMNPLIGAVVSLLLGGAIIWKIGRTTGLPTENMIGVVFSVALALGVLTTPSQDLVEAVFGGNGAVNAATAFASFALAAAVVGFLWLARDRLVLALFNPDLATATGVNVSRLNLLYLLAFASSLALGLRFLGALQVGALIMIPPAIARQFTHTFAAFLVASAAASLAAVILGFGVSALGNVPLGPTIVLVAGAGFGLSLLKRKT